MPPKVSLSDAMVASGIGTSGNINKNIYATKRVRNATKNVELNERIDQLKRQRGDLNMRFKNLARLQNIRDDSDNKVLREYLDGKIEKMYENIDDEIRRRS